ncbi:MAG: hypothetical protein A2Y78_01840 [Acidobacteria bacterium RBG_13_68_16]|nr:MAG: hypothetical protein A2Y78_01840 [Acidobacteria bacterium RBG_13_68_16]
MKRLCLGVFVVALALAAGPAHAGGFTFDAHFTQSDLAGLAEGIGDALTFPNLGTAVPTGLAGFEVLAAAGGPQVDTGSHWWRYVDARTAGGVLYGQRVIVRKGLPFNLDVGVQAGQVAGERFWGGEVRWAVLEGGAVSPAVALRASYSKLSTAPFECEVAEGQLFVSKGFLVVSPYGGIGYRRVSARATFGEPVAAGHSVDLNRGTVTVGARVTLFPLVHLVGEVRKSAKTSIFLGLGVGL